MPSRDSTPTDHIVAYVQNARRRLKEIEPPKTKSDLYEIEMIKHDFERAHRILAERGESHLLDEGRADADRS